MNSEDGIQQDIAIMDMLEKSVMQILKKNKMLQGNKTFGVVTEIVNDKALMVDMTQTNSIEMVRCSPSVRFTLGDRVLVEYINNNPHDRFVVAIISGSVDVNGNVNVCDCEPVNGNVNVCDCEPFDYEFLPYEPVEIIRDETTNKAYLFIYGYDDPDTTWEQELVRNDEGKVEDVIHRYPNGVILIRTLYRNTKGEVFKYE